MSTTSKERVAAYRDKNEAEGKCRRCGESLDFPLYKWCSACRKKSVIDTTAAKKSNRMLGLCYCGKIPEDPRFVRCEHCRKLARESKKRRKQRTPYEQKPQPLTGTDAED